MKSVFSFKNIFALFFAFLIMLMDFNPVFAAVSENQNRQVSTDTEKTTKNEGASAKKAEPSSTNENPPAKPKAGEDHTGGGVSSANKYDGKKHGLSYSTGGPTYPGDVQVYRDVYPVDGEPGTYQVTMRVEAMNYATHPNDLVVVHPAARVYQRWRDYSYNRDSSDVQNTVRSGVNDLRNNGYRNLRYCFVNTADDGRLGITSDYSVNIDNPEDSKEYRLDKNLVFGSEVSQNYINENRSEFKIQKNAIEKAVEILNRNPKANKQLLIVGDTDEDLSSIKGITIHQISTEKATGVNGIYYYWYNDYGSSYRYFDEAFTNFFNKITGYLTNEIEQTNPLDKTCSPMIKESVNAGFSILPDSVAITTEGLKNDIKKEYQPVLAKNGTDITWNIGDTAVRSAIKGPVDLGEQRATYAAELTYKVRASANLDNVKDLFLAKYMGGKFTFNYIPDLSNTKTAQGRVKYFENRQINLPVVKVQTQIGYYTTKGEWKELTKDLGNISHIKYELKSADPDQKDPKNLITNSIMMNQSYTVYDSLKGDKFTFKQALTEEQANTLSPADLKIQFGEEGRVPLSEDKDNLTKEPYSKKTTPFELKRDIKTQNSYKPFTIFVTNELKKDGKLKIKYQINDKDIEANTNGSKYTFKVTGTMPGTSDEVYSKDCSLPDIYGRYELELDNLPIGDYQVVADNPGGEFDSATYYKDSDGMNDGIVQIRGNNKKAKVDVNFKHRDLEEDCIATLRVDSVLKGQKEISIEDLKKDDAYKNILYLQRYNDNNYEPIKATPTIELVKGTKVFKFTWDKKNLAMNYAPGKKYTYSVRDNSFNSYVNLGDRQFLITNPRAGEFVLNEAPTKKDVTGEVIYHPGIAEKEIPKLNIELYKRNSNETKFTKASDAVEFTKDNDTGKYKGTFKDVLIRDKKGIDYEYRLKVVDDDKNSVDSFERGEYQDSEHKWNDQGLKYYTFYNVSNNAPTVAVAPFGQLTIKNKVSKNAITEKTTHRDFKGKLFVAKTQGYNANQTPEYQYGKDSFIEVDIDLNKTNNYSQTIRNIPFYILNQEKYWTSYYHIVEDDEGKDDNYTVSFTDKNDYGIRGDFLTVNASKKKIAYGKSSIYIQYDNEKHKFNYIDNFEDTITVDNRIKNKLDYVAKVQYTKCDHDFPKDSVGNPRLRLKRDDVYDKTVPEITSEISKDGNTITYTYRWKDMYAIDDVEKTYTFDVEPQGEVKNYNIIRIGDGDYKYSQGTEGTEEKTKIFTYKEIPIKQNIVAKINFDKVDKNERFAIPLTLFRKNRNNPEEIVDEKCSATEQNGSYSYTYKDLDVRDQSGLEYEYYFKAKNDIGGTISDDTHTWGENREPLQYYIDYAKSYTIDYEKDKGPDHLGILEATVNPYGTITIKQEINNAPAKEGEYEAILSAWKNPGRKDGVSNWKNIKITLNAKNNYTVKMRNIPYYWKDGNNTRAQLYHKLVESQVTDDKYLVRYKDSYANVSKDPGSTGRPTRSDGEVLFSPEKTEHEITVNLISKGNQELQTRVTFELLNGTQMPDAKDNFNLENQMYLKRNGNKYVEVLPKATLDKKASSEFKKVYDYEWNGLYDVDNSDNQYTYTIEALYQKEPYSEQHLAFIGDRQFLVSWTNDKKNYTFKEIPTKKDLTAEVIFDKVIKAPEELEPEIELLKKADGDVETTEVAFQKIKELKNKKPNDISKHYGLEYKDLPIRNKEGKFYQYYLKLKDEKDKYVKLENKKDKSQHSYNIIYSAPSDTAEPTVNIYPKGTLYIKRLADGKIPNSGVYEITIQGPDSRYRNGYTFKFTKSKNYEMKLEDLDYGTYTISETADPESNYTISVNKNGSSSNSFSLINKDSFKEVEVDAVSKPYGSIIAHNKYDMNSGQIPDDSKNPRLSLYEGSRPLSIKPKVTKDPDDKDAYIYTWEKVPLAVDGNTVSHSVKVKDLGPGNLVTIGDKIFRVRDSGVNSFTHKELKNNESIVGHLLFSKDSTSKPKKIKVELWRKEKGSPVLLADQVRDYTIRGSETEVSFDNQPIRDNDGVAYEYFLKIRGEEGGRYRGDNNKVYAVTYNGMDVSFGSTGALKIKVKVDDKDPSEGKTMKPEEIAKQDRFVYKIEGYYYSYYSYHKCYEKMITLPDNDGNYSMTLTNLPIVNGSTYYDIIPFHGNAAAFPYNVEITTSTQTNPSTSGRVYLDSSNKERNVVINNIKIQKVNIEAINRYDLKNPDDKTEVNDDTIEPRLQLYRNGSALADREFLPAIEKLPGANSYKYNWKDLAPYDENGSAYNYEVKFITDPNNPNNIKLGKRYYKLTQIDANNFVHTEIEDEINLTALVFYGKNAPNKKPPLKLQLYRRCDGYVEKVEEQVKDVVYNAGQFKARFDTQKRHDKGGNFYDYFVRVVGVNDDEDQTLESDGIKYRVIYEGMKVTLVPVTEPVELRVNVNFAQDVMGKDTRVLLLRSIPGGNLEQVTDKIIKIEAKEGASGTATLGEWPLYDDNGNEYTYRVKEFGEKDSVIKDKTGEYLVSYSRAGNIFTIKNSKKIAGKDIIATVKFTFGPKYLDNVYTFSSEKNKSYKAKDLVEAAGLLETLKGGKKKGYQAKNPEEIFSVGEENITFEIPVDVYTDEPVIEQKPGQPKPTVPENYAVVEFSAGEHGKIKAGQTYKYWVDPKKTVTLKAPEVEANDGYKQKPGEAAWDTQIKNIKFAKDKRINANYFEKVLVKDPGDSTNYAKVDFKTSKGTLDGQSEYWVLKNENVSFKEPNVKDLKNHSFVGWDPKIQDSYSDNKTHNATFKYDKDDVMAQEGDEKPDVPDNFVKVVFNEGTNGTIKGNKVFWVNNNKEVTLKEPSVTANNGFKHMGWDQELTQKFTKDNTTITAQYKQICVETDPKDSEDYVKVSFEKTKGDFNGQSEFWVLKNTEVSITPPRINNLSDYEFSRWEPEVKKSYKLDTTHVAKYNYTGSDFKPQKDGEDRPAVPDDFVLVEFKDGEHGKLSGVKKYWVNPTKSVTLSAPDVKADDSYKFTGWNKILSGTFATGTEIVAQYKKIVLESDPSDTNNYAKVEFATDRGTLEGRAVYWVLKNENVNLTQPKVKFTGDYTFSGWDPKPQNVYTEDKTHKASFDYNGKNVVAQSGNKKPDVPEKFKMISFKQGEHGTISDDQTTIYWVNPDREVDFNNILPSIVTDKGYKHTGWSSKLRGTFAKDTDITALYKEKLVKANPNDEDYAKITFKTNKGKLEGTSEYWALKGEKVLITPPNVVSLDNTGYSFVGWQCLSKEWDSNTEMAYSNDTEISAKLNYVGNNVVAQTGSDRPDVPNDFVQITYRGGEHGSIKSGQRYIYWVRPNVNVSLNSPTLEVNKDYKQKDGADAWDHALTDTSFGSATTITAQYFKKVLEEEPESKDRSKYVKVSFVTDKGTIKGTNAQKKDYWVLKDTDVSLTIPSVEGLTDYVFKDFGKIDKTFSQDTTYNATFTYNGKDIVVQNSGTKPNVPENFVKVTFKPGDKGILKGDSLYWVNPAKELDLNSVKPQVIVTDDSYAHIGWSRELKATFTDNTEITALYKQLVCENDPRDTENYAKVEFKTDKGNLDGTSIYWVLKGKTVKIKEPNVNLGSMYEFTSWEPSVAKTYSKDTVHNAKYGYKGKDIVAQSGSEKPDVPKDFVKVTFVADDHSSLDNNKSHIYWVKKGKKLDLTDYAPSINVTDKDYKAFGWDRNLNTTFTENENSIKAVTKVILTSANPNDDTNYAHITFSTEKGNLVGQTEYWALRNEKVSITPPSISGLVDQKFTAWNPEIKNSYDGDQEHKAVLEYNGPDVIAEGQSNIPKDFVKVTFSAGTNGKITKGKSIFYVNPNKKVDLTSYISDLTIVGNENYKFDGWDRILNEKFTVETTITAKYKKILVDTEEQPVIPGTSNPDPAYVKVSFDKGEAKEELTGKKVFWILKGEKLKVIVDNLPSADKLVAWTLGTKEYKKDLSDYDEYVTSDLNFVAKYESKTAPTKKYYSITAPAEVTELKGTKGSGENANKYEENTEVSFKVNVGADKTLKTVKVNDDVITATSGEYKFTITKDTTITVETESKTAPTPGESELDKAKQALEEAKKVAEKAKEALEDAKKKAEEEQDFERKKEALEKVKAEAEKVKAEADKVKAEADKVKSEADKVKAEAEKAKAEADKAIAEADKAKAEADKAKADADIAKAEADKAKQALEDAKKKGGKEFEDAKKEAEKKAEESKKAAEEARKAS
ncbi:Cna B-type domain-containing protein [Peptoniphilus lacrimalis]|uniref:CNA-B domain-containing protein n=1 Tax=Peptoniphilus lacrimalis 315-B TaxID=596330 RepID=D1VUC4_9FIRM|nr:Cna B-type domain-containing protein [Peptoniphilus lacrimalis]EFA89742.1 hypothetical protein HMPREF0628_0425 [Peptoniphilus lacrimalis 315-B]